MNVKLLLKSKKGIALLFAVLLMLCGQNIFAQESLKLTGKIVDSEGSPLPGVNILEKGTSNGTVTDFEGNYTLTLSNANATIVVTSIGYEAKEVSVAGQTTIDISLTPSAELKDEVVIIGYGEMKKSDVTGSVGSLSDKTLTERSVNNPMEAMQGNIPGVTISSSTGRLGDPFQINIRGNTKLENDAKSGGSTVGGTSQPLYIIDGVASKSIDFLNPQDIARMDILKDASSTAIYGSRGSNGVVIITTKGGTTAKKGLSVSFDSYYGKKKVARLPQFMDGPTWWEYHKAAYTNQSINSQTPTQFYNSYMGVNATYPAPNGQNRVLLERALAGESFDWTDAVLQDGMMSNNYLNISGSGDNVSYNFGVGMQNETGLIQKESIDKYSVKAGFDSKISKMFIIGTNITFAKTNQEQGINTAMQDAFRLSPLMTPYELDGVTLCKLPGKLMDGIIPVINKTSTPNPLIDIAYSSDLTDKINLITSSYIEMKPLEWLSLKSTFSTGYENRNRGQSWGAQTSIGSGLGGRSVGQVAKTSYFSYTWDNQFNINYSTSDKKHNFSLLGLQSIYSNVGERTFAYSSNLPFETSFYNLSTGVQSTYVLTPQSGIPYLNDLTPFYSKETLASFALRFNYNYQGKYLVTISNRWDGSSKLSKGNKWGTFPSAAVAWRINEEAFMKGQDIVSNLKLRVSLGYTGNNAVDPYSSVNQLDKPFFYAYGATTQYGWASKNLANPDLTWEKTREFNVGIDFGLLRNRISGSIDVYDRLSKDILMTEKLPLETGWASIIANVGSVSNKGVEISLTTVDIESEMVRWETSFIFSKNVNKVVSIHGQKEKDDIGNNLFIGESVNSIFNYEFDGIVTAEEARVAGTLYASQYEGEAKVKDNDNSGVIDPVDRVILGSADPKWTGSFVTRLTVAGFDLSATILTSQGALVYSPFHGNFINFTDRGRTKLDVPYYVPDNTLGLTPNFSNTYPRPMFEGNYWKNNNIGFIKDASYTKIKNIAVGYTIPDRLLSKVKIKSLRVYFNVIEPFVFTKYDGYDPEWAQASLNLGRVSSITYQFGLNLKF
jgi:TonB-dependent starch-binding outer membrane protein SusC